MLASACVFVSVPDTLFQHIVLRVGKEPPEYPTARAIPKISPQAVTKQYLLQEGGTAPSLGCPGQQEADADWWQSRAWATKKAVARASLGASSLSLQLSSQRCSGANGNGDYRANLMDTRSGSLAARAPLGEQQRKLSER